MHHSSGSFLSGYGHIMLTSFDDFPIHQTAEPIAHSSGGDVQHYDRYFFNGYSKDGSIFFAAAMGLYPNRHVIDASFSVVLNGEQINVHASARAPFERMECTTVGPIKIDVLVPLKQHRVTVDTPEHGIRADITFSATSIPYEEAPFLVRSGNRTTMQYTRMTQLGTWSGWIEVDGVRIELQSHLFPGSRDRSWGVRGIGERVPMGAPPTTPPQFYWLWAPVCFDDFGSVFDVNEYADGERWHESGAMLEGTDTVRHSHETKYKYTWEPGTRRAAAFDVTYRFNIGEVSMHFEPILHFQMLGLGYLHPEWGHGFWKGERVVGGERFSLPVPDPLAMHHLHVQTLSKVICTMPNGDQHHGIGVLETLVLGAHAPSGFTGMSDGYASDSL
jgi:hypothetical protein